MERWKYKAEKRAVIMSFTLPVNNELLKKMLLYMSATFMRGNSQWAEFECHVYAYDVVVIGKGKNSRESSFVILILLDSSDVLIYL